MNIEKIVAAFDFGAPVTAIRECRIGHINSTFFADCANGRFVVQRINRGIFKRPEEIMSNVVGVTTHIRKKLIAEGKDPDTGTLTFVKSGERYFHIDEEGEYWRAYRFVDGDCFNACDSAALFSRVGSAFGRFQRQLADYDAATLYEVIPDFHNTVKRYEAFEAAVAADAVGRAAECAEEIAFIRERRDVCAIIVDGLADGRFPLRVTHNDTKLNNVVMNRETGEGQCVIDLDTVMPGSLLYDFGDAIRFGASSAPEDETDLSRVYVKPEMVAAFTEGFIEGLAGAITVEEIKALPESARVITLEGAIRFLTDYLNGDTYFRIHYPTHNLDRARNQLKLVADMEERRAELEASVAKYLV